MTIPSTVARDLPASDSRSARWWWTASVAALTLAVFSVTLLWALVSAPFSLGDEPRHFNSVLRLMQGGGWPPPKSAPMLEATFVASAEAGYPLSREDLEALPAAQDRSVVTGMDSPVPDEIDWMTQHPPGYYAVVAGAMLAIGADDLRWDQLFFAMRIVSAAIASLCVPFIAGAARLMTGSRGFALVGTAVILAIPQFGHVLSLITNDTLVTLVGAALLYLSVRAMVGEGRLWLTSISAGVALGVGLFTKGLMLAAIPCVLAVFLIAGFRAHRSLWRRLLPAGLSMAIAFAIGGWWWLRNIIVLGEIQPSMMGSGRESQAIEGYDIWFFARTAITRLNHTFWGSIRDSLDLPPVLTAVLGSTALLVILVTIIFSSRRGTFLLLLTYPVLTASLFIFHAWEIYWDLGRTPGIQGRYLFGGVAVLAIAVAFTVKLLGDRLNRWIAVVLAAGTVLVFAGVAGYGLRFTFRAEWASPSGWRTALENMLSAGPWGIGQLVGVAALVVAGLLVAVVGLGVLVISERAPRPQTAIEEPDSVPVPVLER